MILLMAHCVYQLCIIYIYFPAYLSLVWTSNSTFIVWISFCEGNYCLKLYPVGLNLKLWYIYYRGRDTYRSVKQSIVNNALSCADNLYCLFHIRHANDYVSTNCSWMGPRTLCGHGTLAWWRWPGFVAVSRLSVII